MAARAQADTGDADDDAVAAGLLAVGLHEQLVEELGPDHVDTLVATCCLAHALALQGPGMNAGLLIDDAVAGLAETLGEAAAWTRGARILQSWIEEVEDPEPDLDNQVSVAPVDVPRQ